MRTFVAVELNDECRRRLAGAIEKLRGHAGGVRWVDPAIIHLTLKFIGELSEQDLPAAISAISSAAAASQPFRMRIAGIAGFPQRGKPRVIHSPVEEPTGTLAALAGAIDRALLEALGIERESRSFSAHITIGRAKGTRDCPRVEELAAVVPDADFGEVAVDSVVLMKSELRPTGPIYTPIERMKLGA
jgi:2'-5' RNA ligase